MNHSNIIMYTTEDGLTKIETTFEDDTVWLSIDQMAELFQRDKSTISRHIKNIFEEGELQRISVVANFATTAADGKTYNVDLRQSRCNHLRRLSCKIPPWYTVPYLGYENIKRIHEKRICIR